MKVLSSIVLGFSILAAALQPRSSSQVVVVSIDGPIDVASSALLQRALREARQKQATTLIVELNTPGGDIENMQNMGRALTQEKSIETVAFVNSKALSAGAYVALACQKIYMSPSATMGASTPGVMTPQGMRDLSEDHDMKRKHYSSFRADFRRIAQPRGRNTVLAEAFVDPEMSVQKVQIDGEIKILPGDEVDDLLQKGQNVKVLEVIKATGSGPLTLTAQEALSYNMADGIAESREKLFQWLSLEKSTVIEVNATWSEGFAQWLSQIQPVLLILGFVLAFVEMKIPGFGIAGILSIVCFGLLFFGNYLTGLADIFHIVIFVLGFGLILLEILAVPGSIVIGVAGVLCVLYALIFSFTGFYWPAQDQDFDRLKQIAAMFVTSLAIILVSIIFLAWSIPKFFPHLPYFGKKMVMTVQAGSLRGDAAPQSRMGQEKYLGRSGTAVTDLRPAGKIQIENEILDVQSDGAFILKGSAVKVVEISTNRIVVEQEKQA